MRLITSTTPRTIRLVTDTFDGAGPLDTGISNAIARAVGEGTMGETLRLHRTHEVVAFGRQDAVSPRYAEAVRAARDVGCTPVERLAGGRAAAFHGMTLAFSWAIPSSEPRAGIESRFEMVSDLMTTAFRRLGADATVGEVPGEYCPGSYSVNVGGISKVMGVGQRLVRGAAHIGGVVVVGDAARIRDILTPVYRALGLDWVPSTAGALSDAIPDITVESVSTAILDEVNAQAELVPDTIPEEVVAAGRAMASSHHPDQR